MLEELRVENLVLIERAQLRLGPGLNVLTGETGAGKTVLASALDLLLGGRARAGLVRPGASEAYVEGVFALPEALRSRLGEALPADAEDLVLARRVTAEGRSRAWLGGRSCSAGELRDVAAELLGFYGQHEHRRLTLASAQLELLDGACEGDQAARLASCAAAFAEVRGLRERLAALAELAGARERELDLLEFELTEIDDAAPAEDEEVAALARRDRLRHVEALRAGALGACAALLGDEAGEGGAVAGLGAGVAALEGAGGVDEALDLLAVRFRALSYESGDLGAELRGYAEGLEADPAELDAVEDRLALLERLKRKHGGTIAAVLAHAEGCRARRDELLGAEVASEEAAAALAEARSRLARAAAEVHDARAAAAPALAEAVRERLAGLAMEGAAFEVALADREAGPGGADVVEFRIAANPGVPAGPLKDVASGGELSRVMLALAGAAAERSGDGAGRGGAEAAPSRPHAEAAPSGGADAAHRSCPDAVTARSSSTLVFDEVDAGIGGVTARAVGEQLRALAADRQVLCITHLPQIASLGDRHFSIRKDTTVEPARTSVEALAGREVVAELVRMLGAEPDDVAARRHARELRRAA